MAKRLFRVEVALLEEGVDVNRPVRAHASCVYVETEEGNVYLTEVLGSLIAQWARADCRPAMPVK